MTLESNMEKDGHGGIGAEGHGGMQEEKEVKEWYEVGWPR